ncbi:MAG: HDIG domain-containing metalloprotein [Roseimicrobium sp.]
MSALQESVESKTARRRIMLDFIKRAQLARQGLSCGKTRRKHLHGEVWDTLRCHPLVGAGIFVLAFCCVAGVLDMLKSGLPGTQTGQGMISAAIFVIAAMHWWLTFRPEIRTNGTALLVFFSILLQLVGAGVMLSYGEHRGWGQGYTLLLLPHAISPVILSMMIGQRCGLYGTLYATLLGATLVEDAQVLAYVCTGLGIGFVGVHATRRVRRRSRLLTSGFYVGGVAMAMMMLLAQAPNAMATGEGALRFAAPMLAGIVTVMLAGAVMPALEALFHRTTAISWLELGDLNHPLMRRLSIEAPGTYHHSLVVANLAEAAAEAIAANASMCRVCAYFHDIGKLTKPEYFIENMDPDDNPHDDLTARMSALVLIAHVKDGVDLALKHGLNIEIVNVIEQHHGNSLVYFFYRRALDQKKELLRLVEQDKAREDDVPDVAEESFRYPGPRPQFKESAIISLADAVESASRTLVKPTPARVEQLVEDIVRNRLLDHQLDECNLTLAELADIKLSFVKTLLSMMHNRIKYPKTQEDVTRDEAVRRQAIAMGEAPARKTKIDDAA